jgi:hypothetical protein
MKPLTFEAVTRDPELKQMLNHHASGTHLAAARKG